MSPHLTRAAGNAWTSAHQLVNRPDILRAAHEKVQNTPDAAELLKKLTEQQAGI